MRASVDVILPVFNGTQTLARAVNSVLSQVGDFSIHLYCVDDGSHDDSTDVLRRLAQGRSDMTVVVNSANMGVSATRNLGVAAGNADFVAFIDQDDEWLPNKLNLQMAGFESAHDVRYSTGLQHILLDEGAVRPSWCRQEWLDKPMTGFLPSTLLMTRATWDSVGVFDVTMKTGGDDVEWFARARRRDVNHFAVGEVVIRRFISGRNLSSDAVNTTQDLLTAVRRQFAQKGPGH